MWTTVTLSLLLVAASAGLLLWHWQAWRTADHGGLGEREANFLRRQFRRRSQASGMLGVVGLLLLGDLWISDPFTVLLYWCGVALVVLWTMLLSLVDWLASRQYYGRLSTEGQTEHALLKAAIEKHRRESSSPPSP